MLSTAMICVALAAGASQARVAPGLGAERSYTPARAALRQAGFLRLDLTCRPEAREAVLSRLQQFERVQLLFDGRIGADPVLVITAHVDDIRDLARIPGIVSIEESADLAPRNSSTRWLIQSTQPEHVPLYDAGLTGDGQVAGILDTPVSPMHCAFVDDEPVGPTHRKLLAYNAPLGSSPHGTHVACTAVGDSGAADDTRGVAYGARLVYGTGPEFGGAQLFEKLSLHHAQGARVHINSFGDEGTTLYNALSRAIDTFAWQHEDSLVIFAISSGERLANPENAKNALAVTASADWPQPDAFCIGGAGPTADGRQKPDLAAPGCAVWSAVGDACGVQSMSGTSFAAPAVAGAALLVREYFEAGYYPSGQRGGSAGFTPTAALLKAALINSAVDLTAVPGSPSELEGWGRPVLDRALHLGNSRRLIVRDRRNRDGLTTGDIEDVGVRVHSSAEPLEMTLVWTDPPAPASAGASSAGAVWINDLDLEVHGPVGAVYRGNALNAGVSIPDGPKDAINNVERVIIPLPEPGFWRVRVRGAAVTQPTQGFALAINGDVQQVPAGLSVWLPDGPPVAIPPPAANITVRLRPGPTPLVPGSPQVFHRIAGEVQFQTTPLIALGGEAYAGIVPAGECGQTVEFYVAAQSAGGAWTVDPPDAPEVTYAAPVGSFVTLVADNFETDTGWQLDLEASTAVAGQWIRGDPVGTLAQPEDAHSPPNCWFTGQGLPGESDPVADVDGGATVLLSPVFDLTSTVDPKIHYQRWFSTHAGTVSEDVLLVQLSDDGGRTWTTVDSAGPGGFEAIGGWIPATVSVREHIAVSEHVRFRVVASDLGTPNVVEAALDDFRITDFRCPLCPGDLNLDGAVDLADLGGLLAQFGCRGGPLDCPADWNADGVVDLEDLAITLNAYEQACP